MTVAVATCMSDPGIQSSSLSSSASKDNSVGLRIPATADGTATLLRLLAGAALSTLWNLNLPAASALASASSAACLLCRERRGQHGVGLHPLPFL